MNRSEATAKVDAGLSNALVAPEPGGQDGYRMHFCRGVQGACPSTLMRDPSAVSRIELAVRASAYWQCFQRRNSRVLPHHLRLRVAFAACPNACTMPQIRDIGIIASMTPRAVRSECDGCGRCEQTCRETAITVRHGRAELHEAECVGCGQCIDCCPNQAIEPGPVRLRILVGGKMGRHPRWARELCEADSVSAPGLVRTFLDCVAQEMQSGKQPAEAMETVWTRT